MNDLLEPALRWVAFVAGSALVVATWKSIVVTFILPRAITSRITFLTWRLTFGLFENLAGRRDRLEPKDGILALLGPISLLTMLVTWMILFVIGYALIFLPFIAGGFPGALKLSGSSFFTLGVVSSPKGAPTLIEFIAAGSGMIVIAIQIGYLPTIYGAYNRRETLVVALASRAGSPAWGPEILARHSLANALETLPALYASWELWAADITESHVSHPWLMAFRSPDPMQSWIVSLLAVLDSAALWVALAPSAAPPEARQCLRAGYVAMRSLAKMAGNPIENEPDLSQNIRLPFPVYQRGVEVIEQSGFPTEVNAQVGWRRFSRWRLQYEEAAVFLADQMVAVPAPWSGRRSSVSHEEMHEIVANRPAYLTPDDDDFLMDDGDDPSALVEAKLASTPVGGSGGAEMYPKQPGR